MRTVDSERGSYRIVGFVQDEVDVYGGPPNREMYRTFRAECIGSRPRSQEHR